MHRVLAVKFLLGVLLPPSRQVTGQSEKRFLPPVEMTSLCVPSTCSGRALRRYSRFLIAVWREIFASFAVNSRDRQAEIDLPLLVLGNDKHEAVFLGVRDR